VFEPIVICGRVNARDKPQLADASQALKRWRIDQPHDSVCHWDINLIGNPNQPCRAIDGTNFGNGVEMFHNVLKPSALSNLKLGVGTSY
jgi:hypothetical protein